MKLSSFDRIVAKAGNQIKGFNVSRFIKLNTHIPISLLDQSLQILQKRHFGLQSWLVQNGKYLEKRKDNMQIKVSKLVNYKDWQEAFIQQQNMHIKDTDLFLQTATLSQNSNDMCNQFIITMPHFIADGVSINAIVNQLLETCNILEQKNNFDELYQQNIFYEQGNLQKHQNLNIFNTSKGVYQIIQEMKFFQQYKGYYFPCGEEIPFVELQNAAVFRQIEGFSQIKEKLQKYKGIKANDILNSISVQTAYEFKKKRNQPILNNGFMPIVTSYTLSLRPLVTPKISEHILGNFATVKYQFNLVNDQSSIVEIAQNINQSRQQIDVQSFLNKFCGQVLFFKFLLMNKKPLPKKDFVFFHNFSNFGALKQNKNSKYQIQEMYSLPVSKLFAPLIFVQTITINNNMYFSFTYTIPFQKKQDIDEYADLFMHKLKQFLMEG